MTLTAKILTALVRALIAMTCKVDDRELHLVPKEGPLVVLFNHINFLEAPLIRTKLIKRDVYALTKQETWKNPIFRILADSWGGIPIDRSNPAVSSMRNAELVLKEQKVLFVAPEGTRSGNGQLGRGNPGLTSLALRTKSTVVPLAHYGGENFWPNLKRLKRTPITFRIGPLITIDAPHPVTKQARLDITDQLMYELAALLPQQYRGEYAEQRQFERDYLIRQEQNASLSH